MGDVGRMIIELSVLDEGDLDSYAQIKQEFTQPISHDTMKPTAYFKTIDARKALS